MESQTFKDNINPRDDETWPPMYIVTDYCEKYPDDPGNETIHPEDVVRPRNHKWANIEEQRKWMSDNSVSKAKVPTYGTCGNCWASGPNYQPCRCDMGSFKPLELRGWIIDSQTFSEKWDKKHYDARAGLTQNYATIDTMKFDRTRIEKRIKEDFDKGQWISGGLDWIIREFFQEYDQLLNQRRIRQDQDNAYTTLSGRIRQQQECVGETPETPENVTTKKARQEST